MKKILLYIFLILLPTCWLSAQRVVADREARPNSHRVKSGGGGHFGTDEDQNDDSRRGAGRNGKNKDKDKKEADLPTDLKTWKADPMFGVVDSVEVDTMPHYFQNECFTHDIRWQHNTLGNAGSPRVARLLADRPLSFNYFIFTDPYDYFITPFSDLHFTNTKSPITNITYHETTGKETGEDHIKALYAVNAGKDVGLGLKLDYLYGRGEYASQSTSDFNATLFGSIMKEKYKAHFAFYANYLKTAENGGITDDSYVKNPENFPSKFETSDIPTRLSKVWNKMYHDGLQWTHRYSMGFYKSIPLDSLQIDSLRKLQQQNDPFAAMKPKSASDSLLKDSFQTDRKVFVPVTSIIHTIKFQSNERDFIANEKLSSFYSNKYYAGDSTFDKTTNTYVSNMVSLELHEGFNKWSVAGIRLFGIHDFNNYKMPVSRVTYKKFTENEFTLGAQLFKEKGKHLGYHLTAQTTSDGKDWGEFQLRGEALYKVKFLGDSLRVSLQGNIINKKPTFFYEHFTSQYLSWDNSLSKQFTTHIGGKLQCDRTRTTLTADIRNIKNYTYFANTALPSASGSTYAYTYNTEVRQLSDNLQLLSLSLNQDFKLGPLNWENQFTYQECTKQDVLPAPKFNLYSNLYLLFRIAKVLRVELGGDVRFFTSYYAPTYSPAIGQFTLQAPEDRIKIGDYPIVNVYANFHLKHTRFYIMAEHVNYSSDGKGSKFLAPHYPINPMTIHLGLSWNFFN